jgi:hypothetical protein
MVRRWPGGVEKRGVKIPMEVQKQAVLDLDEKIFGVRGGCTGGGAGVAAAAQRAGWAG